MCINERTKYFVFKLKANKMAYGLKYKEVAQTIGISSDFLYHVLAGDRNLPKKYWETLESFLDNFEKEQGGNIKIIIEKAGE